MVIVGVILAVIIPFSFVGVRAKYTAQNIKGFLHPAAEDFAPKSYKLVKVVEISNFP